MSAVMAFRHVVIVLGMVPLLLVGCGGGGDGDDGAKVASIAVTPADVRLGVGLTQTLTAEARDASGKVLSGVQFTWTSSNPAAGRVEAGIATGVAPGTTQVTASAGGVTSAPAQVTVVAYAQGAVVIDQPGVFFSAVGQGKRLGARILDAQGNPAPGGITWRSSAPDKVSVDASGQVVALAVGSAVLTADAGGGLSAPAIVVVAEPKAGALLVTDDQVVSVGAPAAVPAGRVAPLGAQFEVHLQGVAAPAAGTVVLAAETAPVAGKVVAARDEAGELVVTLAVTPLHELFADYDIRLNLDLAAFGFEPATPRVAAQGAVWRGAERQRALAQMRPQALAFFKPFKAWDCEAKLEPQLVGKPIQLSLENELKLIVEDRPGYSRRSLEGSAAIVGSAGLKLKAGFKASGKCEAQGQIKFPVFGWFSAIVMPAVRFGIGGEVEGEVLVVQAELGIEGKVGFKPQLGWECGGAAARCIGLDGAETFNELKTKSKLPSERDMQAKVSAQFYVLAGLDATILGGVANAQLVEARVGPKQSFDLGFENDQAARADYAASYDLKLEAVVEPGASIKDAIKALIDDDQTGLSFKAEAAKDLSESPKGSLAISASRARPGQVVDFTVTLAPPKTLEYWLLGYNVTGVQIYRRREGETDFTEWKAANQIASNTFTYRWTPTAADAGNYEFAAFVNTQLLTPLLEVAPNSIKELQVSCFSGPNAATREKAAQATAGEGRVQPLAATCEDTWVGSATVIGMTPGLPPGDNITATTTNMTWKYARTEVNGTIVYVPGGGTFTLAFNQASTGCTTVLEPNIFTIVNDPVAQPKLLIDKTPLIPPRYFIAGVQLVNFQSTVSCPGEAPVVTQVNNFRVDYASGSGPWTDGQTTLSGTYQDAQFDNTWNFTRP